MDFLCKTHFNYNENKIRCSCNISDEILAIDDYTISNIIKDIQFPKIKFDLINIYSLIIILIFLLLLLLPSIYYLREDITKGSILINNNKEIKEVSNDCKIKCNEVKKYSKIGIFLFSFYIALNNYPYFAVFNKHYINYPRIIIHLIVIIGLFIGIISSLIPYYFITFIERDIFISQRDIQYEDTDIQYILSVKYQRLSIIFGFLGILLGNLFIYIFAKILNLEKEDIDTWRKIKIIFKDYMYYEIKSEVLLGYDWKKIRNRMIAFYSICNDYILKQRKNNKFKQYLR